MKKTIITSIMSLAIAGSVLAQGTVNWVAVTPTFMTAGINNATYSTFVGPQAGQATGIDGAGYTATATTANSYYYQLLYQISGSQLAAPTSLDALNAFSASPAQTAINNTGTAGRISVSTSSATSATPAGWDQGVKATIILVGWSSNLGTTWSDVLAKLNNWGGGIENAYFGVSSSGYISPNAPGSPGATLFGSSANANGTPINSANTPLYLLSTTPVPEPATMALAALGGASLLLFRRRK
jgi:hypothetical protein